MRSQLLACGLLVILMGVAFYLLEIPLVYAWSVPFVAGGAVMALASPFVSSGPGAAQAPDGYRFCRFCSASVPLKAGRCPQCNGLQPREAS